MKQCMLNVKKLISCGVSSVTCEPNKNQRRNCDLSVFIRITSDLWTSPWTGRISERMDDRKLLQM